MAWFTLWGLLLVMSFVALLRGQDGRKAEYKKKYIRDAVKVEKLIEQGKQVHAFLEQNYGYEKASEILRTHGSQPRRAGHSQPSGSQPRQEHNKPGDEPGTVSMPYGFWRRFMQDAIGTAFSKRKRQQLMRSFKYYAERRAAGATTDLALRHDRKVGSCRGSGGSQNHRRVPGLGFALLQFFVDNVQRLMTRADSHLLMAKARIMKQQMLVDGHAENALPKLEGSTGWMWFSRWRKLYGIVKKVIGMKLKVSWKKIRKRISVFLCNVYRLRAFWEICHPGVPMRFISLDQKPSWFNNAGHTGTYAKKGGSQPSVREDFNATRQRYTILTAVPTWGHSDPNAPPKICILFKAKPGGTVVRDLRNYNRLEPWMHVQVQEHGSYKSVDVVEALDWMLPDAANSSESIVVMLDWYSGHLTPEVQELVQKKGHVLIFHGGGCTPFTQVNDTHLHAVLARLLIQIENDWALGERQRLLDIGKNKTPKMTREQIISIVQSAWLAIEHGRIAEKAYMQTGPTMPLQGTVHPDDVFQDLWNVMVDLDPDNSTPTSVGMTLRDDAVAFVKEGYATGKWTEWKDAHKLIEEHDGLNEALEEGLEAFGAEACDTDDEKEESLSSDEDIEDISSDSQPSGPAGSQPSAKAPADADMFDASDKDDADDEGDADGEGDGGSQPRCKTATLSDEAKRSIELATARRLLYDEAVRTRDDTMLRTMRKQLSEQTQLEKAASNEIGKTLVKRAREDREDEAKRRRADVEAERLAAKSAEDAKLATAKVQKATAETKLAIAQAQKATADARCQALKQIVANRRELKAKKNQETLEKLTQTWLQTKYPVEVANRCITHLRLLSKEAKTDFQKHVEKCLADGTFTRMLLIVPLWETNKSLTLDYSYVSSFTDGHRRQVRCCRQFEDLIDIVAAKGHFGKDPVETLYRLWEKCVPRARSIFTASSTPLRMLHANDYVMEKAFVYGIVSLSKWLGKERFPQGIYGDWPPNLPKRETPVNLVPPPIDLVDPPLLPPPAAAVLGDLPPHLRQGLPSAGSKSTVQ